MHQCRTIAHIVLILSIFYLVFAVPVIRETFDAYGDGDVVVPAVMRNAAAMSKDRRQPESDGSTPSPSSSRPPDESMTLPSPDESMALDGLTSLHESPGGLNVVAVSPPPDETASLPDIPALDQPVPSTSMAQHYIAVRHDTLNPSHPRTNMEKLRVLGAIIAVKGTVLVTGWLLRRYRSRTVGPDWYVSNPSHPSCGHLNVLNHKCLT